MRWIGGTAAARRSSWPILRPACKGRRVDVV
jgi:hypothetical protein